MSKNPAKKSSRRRGVQSEGFWAGYVGALVNVVLTLLFLVAVLAAESYVLGVEFSRKIVASALEASRQKLLREPEARPDVDRRIEPETIEVVEVPLPETSRQVRIDTIRSVERQELLQVRFPSESLELNDVARQALLPRFREFQRQSPGAVYTVWALSDADPQNRRVSFIRIMALRKALAEAGIENNRVVTRILPGRSTTLDGQLVYVLVRVTTMNATTDEQ